MKLGRNLGRMGMKYKFESLTIGDCCNIVKKSIQPKKGEIYTCFSLPAYDHASTPEILNGEDITKEPGCAD